MANLLGASYPSERLGQIVLAKELGDQIRRVIREQRHAGRIVERDLAPRRKLLLTGPPGTDLAAGLSYAEVVRAADEVLKDALIHERPLVREADVRVMLNERRTIADKLAARRV